MIIIGMIQSCHQRIGHVVSYALVVFVAIDCGLRTRIERARRAQEIRDLRAMDDRLLRDIGLTRCEIEGLLSRPLVDEDDTRTAMPARSVAMTQLR
jgi:uncharacterized protein YjiS (DUF1127 family)